MAGAATIWTKGPKEIAQAAGCAARIVGYAGVSAGTIAQMRVSESQIAHHRGQLEIHARQEAFHVDQKVVHETELGKAVERFKLLKAASEALGDMVVDVKPAAPAPAAPPPDIPTSGWRWLSRLMAFVLEGKAPDEVFGPSSLADEIVERWGAKLKQDVDPRSVSATLRRWAAEG